MISQRIKQLTNAKTPEELLAFIEELVKINKLLTNYYMASLQLMKEESQNDRILKQGRIQLLENYIDDIEFMQSRNGR